MHKRFAALAHWFDWVGADIATARAMRTTKGWLHLSVVLAMLTLYLALFAIFGLALLVGLVAVGRLLLG